MTDPEMIRGDSGALLREPRRSCFRIHAGAIENGLPCRAGAAGFSIGYNFRESVRRRPRRFSGLIRLIARLTGSTRRAFGAPQYDGRSENGNPGAKWNPQARWRRHHPSIINPIVCEKQ
jgi:hypothetical protein